MKSLNRSSDQRGIAHLLEIVIIGVIVLGVAGFIGWRVFFSGAAPTSDSANNNAAASEELQSALTNAKCDYTDADICKFFVGWKQADAYSLLTTTTSDGQTNVATFESSHKGERTRVSMNLNGAPYEVISINGTTYTKAGDTWWKQTAPKQEQSPDTPVSDVDVDFTEPSADLPPAQLPTYERQGTEACGDLQCFKYKVSDPSTPDITQYIWFDTKDYQLRRMLSQSAGYTSDSVFTYSGVNIAEPSPVKELAPNQYLVPGQSEPATLPDLSDYDY